MEDEYKYFKIEAEEILENLTKGLLQLDKRPEDQDLIKELFRYAHTLKGAAGVVKLSTISQLAHKAEDRLALFRDQNKRPSAEDVTLLLEVVTVIGDMVEALREGKSENFVDSSVVLKKLEGKGEEEGQKVKVESERVEIYGKDKSEIDPQPEINDSRPATSSTGAAASSQQNLQQILWDKHRTGQDNNNQRTTGKDTEIIRIETRDMDKLTNLSDEIMTNTARMKDILEQFMGVTRQSGKLASKYKGMGLSEISQPQEHFHKQLQNAVDHLEQAIQRMDLLYYEMNGMIMTTRLESVKNFTYLFEKTVRDLAIMTKKKVDLSVEGKELLLDRALLDQIKEPIYHLLRNCVSHGLEAPSERVEKGKDQTGLIRLKFEKIGSAVRITCQDDGRGLDLKKIKEAAVKKNLIDQNKADEMSDEDVPYLILKSGFSSAEILTELSGRGVGLDVVKSSVNALGGSLSIVSEKGKFTCFELNLPLSVNVTDVFMVEVASQNLLIPLRSLVETRLIEEEEIASEAGRRVIQCNGSPIPLVSLADLLGLESKADNHKKAKIILVKANVDKAALIIDEFKGRKKILPKSLDGYLRKIGYVHSSTILGNGDPAFVLDIADIFERIKSQPVKTVEKIQKGPPPNILVVDDSLTTRILIKGILEAEGYLVRLAESGEEALEILEKDLFNLIISDIEMPGINGFELSQKIRQSDKDKDIPIIILTSMASETDKRRGIEVGANAYIVKGAFEQGFFLEMVERLI